MCESYINYIDGLLLACPQLGTRPATQACALTGVGIELATLWFTGQHLLH